MYCIYTLKDDSLLFVSRHLHEVTDFAYNYNLEPQTYVITTTDAYTQVGNRKYK